MALALHNVLGDLCASLSIALDKPFVVGETIQVEEMTGTVESIGVKTTRLRATTRRAARLGNGELLKSRAHPQLRQDGGAAGDAAPPGGRCRTPVAAAAAIPELLRAGVEARQTLRFERAHLAGFCDGALDYEVSYLVLSPDQTLHMDRQHAILLAWLEGRFERHGIALAHPARRVELEGGAAAGGGEPPSQPGAASSVLGNRI